MKSMPCSFWCDRLRCLLWLRHPYFFFSVHELIFRNDSGYDNNFEVVVIVVVFLHPEGVEGRTWAGQASQESKMEDLPAPAAKDVL